MHDYFFALRVQRSREATDSRDNGAAVWPVVATCETLTLARTLSA